MHLVFAAVCHHLPIQHKENHLISVMLVKNIRDEIKAAHLNYYFYWLKTVP